MVYNVTMIRTQILLPESVFNELKLMASTERRSISDIVREALTLLLNDEKDGKETLGQLVKDAFSSKNTPRDLSTNDEYLYGKDTL